MERRGSRLTRRPATSLRKMECAGDSTAGLAQHAKGHRCGGGDEQEQANLCREILKRVLLDDIEHQQRRERGEGKHGESGDDFE